MAGVGSLVVTSNGMIRVVAMVPSLRQGQASLLRGVGVGVGVSAATTGDAAPVSPKAFAVRSQLEIAEGRTVPQVAKTQTVAAVQPRTAEIVTVQDKQPVETEVQRRADEQARPVVSADEEIKRRRAEAIDALLKQFERKREEMGDASLSLDSQAKRGQVVALFGMFQPAGQQGRSALNLVG